jgi:hypothetical protein
MRNHVRTAIALVLLVLFAAPLHAGQLFDQVAAEESGTQVVIRWKTLDESGCTGFYVERSVDGVTYTRLNDTPMTTEGSGHLYTFVDRYVFKQTSRTFFYRVKGLSRHGQSVDSDNIRVELSLSGIEQTWGGLKAMFR